MEKANVIKKAFYRSTAYLKRHSPTILTFVGATGVVATVIMSARATPKAMMLLEEAEAQKGEELDKLETIRTAAPAYIPVAAIGISSLICLFGANVLNQRNQASLTAAYAMLNESYSRYRGAANTVFGDDADSKIKAEVAKETYLQTNDKKYWWQMIQLLPSSYNQRRTVMLNYEVLANIYKSRRNHKLDEWRELCDWIESLPYSELITGPDLSRTPICDEIIEEAKKKSQDGYVRSNTEE